MRLKHIYITKEGEPMANPEMELLDWPSAETRFMEYQKYHSGLLPFEESSDILRYIKLIKNDTIVLVDLEVEVVEQWNANGIWLDRPEHRQGTPIYQETKYEYRKVLRIKP